MSRVKAIIKKIVPKPIIIKYKKIKFKRNVIKNLNRDSNHNYKYGDIKLISTNKTFYHQTAMLFSNIVINYYHDYYFYSLDYCNRLFNENIVIDNMPVDYSFAMSSFNSLREKTKTLQGIDEVLESIEKLINRITDEYETENDRDKVILKYLKNIISEPVSHFDEALQRILFYNQLLWQTNHKLVGLGRLDKVLIEYYQNDINNKIITKSNALNMIKEFLKILHKDYCFKSSALLGDTGQIIILGGYDENNEYICNDLTYLFIDAISELQLPDPKILLRTSKETPRKLMEASLKCIKTGIGCPLFSNDDVVIEALLTAGTDKQDVNNYVTSACWEPLILGKSFDQNNVKNIVFLEPLNRVFRNNKTESISSFKDLEELYKQELKSYVKEIVKDVNSLKFQQDPLMSIFTQNCVNNNKDISIGGAKYNNIGLLSLGLSNTVNSLLVLKKYVFEDKKYSLTEINNKRINNQIDELTIEKKFGNDDNEVINLTQSIMDIVSNELKKYKNSLGGNFKFGLSSPGYISCSDGTEASFDGRKANSPYSVHISSNDALAYTELVQFAGKLDYSINKYNGNVVDFFVAPSLIDNNFDKFVDFLMLSLNTGFFEMQMNVVSSDTLIAARENPDKFPNLIVRVWGFSAYFKDLPDEYKELMIERALKNEGKI